MSKTLRTVATIAGAVALIATGIGAAGGLGLGAKTLATISTIGKIASVTATVASVGAQLTAPKPIAKGSPAQVVIDIEPPRPYIVGQVMTGGVMRHDVAYGATLKKVPNPFRWQVRVLSGVGPIQGIVGEYFDFTPVDNGYFGGFFNSVQNLGTRPQTTALVPPYGAAPGWTTSSRLSGCAHVGLNFQFDRDGKVFASGLPIYTALCEGEKVYDPRQDSTYPGGSGACRAGVESTYVYNRNPACHAVTYALGRFQNGRRVFGLGQPVDTLDMAAIVDWANDCDANEWTVNMILTEGGTGANLREQRVRNLDDLCAAGGARWYQAGGLLSFDWHRPRLALATLTDDDILEAGGGTDAVQTVRDRMNGVRPQYVSPDHNWQQITAAEIVGSTYRTEDGGEKLVQVYPLNGVTNAAQAGELAAYAMTDSREIGPMDLQAKAKWRFYRPGDCIEIDSSLVAYDGLAVINQRSLNPQSLAVALSLKSETPGKHDFALGKVASPPPTPTLLQTTEERDLLAAAAITPRAVDVEFDDNTDLESLKPGEAGSTRNVPRGTYAAGTTYVRGDSVLFSGSSYQLIVASSTGNAPPDVARWALLANAGSGPAGADGLPGLTVIVSNEAHVVATAADGSGGDYTGAGGQMRVLRGETVLTPAFSIAAKTPNTSWISIDSSGNYTVTDPGVDLATATLRAVNVSVNYDRTYTLARSKQGVTGPRLALAADNQAFTFTDGAANPGSQTITIDALLNNLSGTATWSTTPAVTLGGSGNTRTLTVADFGANRQVTVEATLGGITDKITIVRLERDVSAPANANRVPFSRMEGDRGWAVLSNPSGLAVSTLYAEFQAMRFFKATFTATAAGQSVSIGIAQPAQPAFRLTPEERISFQSRVESVGAGAGLWTLALWGFRADGTSAIIASTVGGNRNIGSGFVQLFASVPSDIISGRIELYNFTGGAGAVDLVISEPIITSAAAGQTVHPPYTPGPNAVDGALPNNLITIDGGGLLQGIGSGAGEPVNNKGVVLSGLLSARPGSGAYIGQTYTATDTREFFRWDGSIWQPAADITAVQQRSIEPQFPSIEVKQGEAGHTGNRTVMHTAKRGTSTLSGGAWSLPSVNLGAGSATINSGSGTVTLSGIVQSGAYAVRYTHTDSLATDLAVNVTYVPTPASGVVSAKTGNTTSSSGVGNTGAWVNVITLTLTGCPTGRLFFNNIGMSGGNRIDVSSGTGTCDHQARVQINGTTVDTSASQNTVSGGVIQLVDYSDLFDAVHSVSSGTVTVTVDLQRTSGTGTISTMSNSLDVTIIAT
jgi:hypothetical protein